MIKIAKYKNTRHWAVWQGERLLAVVCYKKGAKTLKQVLIDLLNKPANEKQSE